MNINPAIIMAIGGIITGIGGLLLSRRGQEATARQAEAAGRLQTRVQAVAELEGLVDRYKAEAEAAITSRDAARASEAEIRTRLAAIEGQLVDCQTSVALAQEQTRRALSDLSALRLIVMDEVARGAADAAWGALDHPKDDKETP